MNFKNINNFLLLLLLLLYSCSSLEILSEKNESLEYNEILESNSQIDSLYYINQNNKTYDYFTKSILFSEKFNGEFNKLKSIKSFKDRNNENLTHLHFFYDEMFITIDDKSIINFYNIENFKLIKTIKISFDKQANSGYPISVARINDNFFLNYSNGYLISFKLDGKINWENNSDNLFKTPIKIFNNNIILLSGNKIYSFQHTNGKLNWEFSYEGDKFFQHSGGDITNINHILYFILPNKNVGIVDTIFGEKLKTIFSDIKFINSMNNTNDKIHTYNNYLSYFDQKKYLYTIDTNKNILILDSKKIQNVQSFYFYNNILITFNKDSLFKLYNILNKNIFWEKSLIDHINNDDTIIKVISLNNSIFVFFKSGKFIEFNTLNGDIIYKNKLKAKNIVNIEFFKDYLITIQKNRTYTFFSQ